MRRIKPNEVAQAQRWMAQNRRLTAVDACADPDLPLGDVQRRREDERSMDHDHAYYTHEALKAKLPPSRFASFDVEALALASIALELRALRLYLERDGLDVYGRVSGPSGVPPRWLREDTARQQADADARRGSGQTALDGLQHEEDPAHD